MVIPAVYRLLRNNMYLIFCLAVLRLCYIKSFMCVRPLTQFAAALLYDYMREDGHMNQDQGVHLHALCVGFLLQKWNRHKHYLAFRGVVKKGQDTWPSHPKQQLVVEALYLKILFYCIMTVSCNYSKALVFLHAQLLLVLIDLDLFFTMFAFFQTGIRTFSRH